jgi:hypothetical protein
MLCTSGAVDQQIEVRCRSDSAKNHRFYGPAPGRKDRVAYRPADATPPGRVLSDLAFARPTGIAGFAIMRRSGQAISASPVSGLKHPRFCM